MFLALGMVLLVSMKSQSETLSLSKNESQLRNDFKSIQKAMFHGLNLRGATFYLSRINEGDFSEAQLPESQFRASSIQGANFISANLISSDFSAARAASASFFKSNLIGCKCNSADFFATDFREAHLESADFSNSVVAMAHFEGAFFNSFTKLPFSRSEAFRRGMIFK